VFLLQPFATAGSVAQSRQAVIDHGGKVWAESSRRGARFVFRLPITILQARAASCWHPCAPKYVEPALLW